MNNNLYNNYFYNYANEYLGNHLKKPVEVHASFSDSIEWRDTIFKGLIEAIGKDYIVINNNSKKYVIWSIYIDYIVLL